MKTQHILLFGIVLIFVASAVYFVTTGKNDSEKNIAPIVETPTAPAVVSPEQASPVPTATTRITSTTTTTQTTTTKPGPKNVTITYGANGFSPASITIQKGDTVTFVAAAGSGRMWVASDQHPSHQGYSGTSKSEHCTAGYNPAPFDACTNGTSFSFTFGKTGSWGYHNHSNAGDGGTVVVK